MKQVAGKLDCDVDAATKAVGKSGPVSVKVGGEGVRKMAGVGGLAHGYVAAVGHAAKGGGGGRSYSGRKGYFGGWRALRWCEPIQYRLCRLRTEACRKAFRSVRGPGRREAPLRRGALSCRVLGLGEFYRGCRRSCRRCKGRLGCAWGRRLRKKPVCVRS